MHGAKKYLLIFFLAAISFLSGCYNDFDPLVEGTYDNLMVFSVLDNRSDIQFAYAQKNYQYLSERKNFSGLELWISEKNGNSYKFRDTAIDNDNFKIYYIDGLKPQFEKTYNFYVVKDSSIKENAIVNIPTRAISSGQIFYREPRPVLEDPYPFHGMVNFSNSFLNSKNNFYYKYELLVEFNKTENGKVISFFRHIPDSASFDAGLSLDGLPSKRPAWDIPLEMLRPMGGSEFSKTRKTSHTIYPLSIIYALQLFDINERKDITFKRAFVVIHTADDFFYENYMKRSWDQKISSRFDTYAYSPDIFSHSDKIMGVFGAISADTFNFPVESKIIDMWGYKNGQE